jgi:hypothetical protein
VTIPERSAGVRKIGWQFHVPVYFGIVGGALLIILSEMLNSAHLIPVAVKDAGLVAGGALLGLVALLLNETYRVEPERARIEREREAERHRHQEERRLDFEQYRALQSELREARSTAATLQSRLNLSGAIDRDRVGDALLLGFYFHRRNERLPSAPKLAIFTIAAKRLKLVREKNAEIKVDKTALREVLEIAYGSVVSEAFDLGYLLSHLGEDGVSTTRSPEILAQLQEHLNALKLNGKAGAGPNIPSEAVGLFKKLGARVVEIVKRF